MNLEIANIFREIAYILEMGVTEKDGEDQKSKARSDFQNQII